MIILDSSIFLAALFPDEQDAVANEIMESIATGDSAACVPVIFCTEVANACLMAFRRKRINRRELFSCIVALMDCAIPVDRDNALPRRVELAVTYDLTLYDATYLELAERYGGQLATRDKALKKAALDAGYILPALI